MKNLKTNNKLFYGKWPYKVDGNLVGAYAIRFSPKFFKEWVTNPTQGYRAGASLDKNEVVDFREIIETLKVTLSIRVRADSRSFSIFCIDRSSVDSVISILKKWVHTTYSPESDNVLDFIQNNSNKLVIVNHFPHEKYRYKVWLNSKASSDTKQRFLKWTYLYAEKIKIADSTTKWLATEAKRWYTSPFIYVDSQSTLLLVNMYLGGNIKKTEEFILKSSINTPLGLQNASTKQTI